MEILKVGEARIYAEKHLENPIVVASYQGHHEIEKLIQQNNELKKQPENKVNQPKFKIGEKVKSRLAEHIGEISSITIYKDKIDYEYKNGFIFEESELELYTEPKTRKLFAYSVNDEEIRFSETGLVTLKNGEKVRRRPEFDINYSDKE